MSETIEGEQSVSVVNEAPENLESDANVNNAVDQEGGVAETIPLDSTETRPSTIIKQSKTSTEAKQPLDATEESGNEEATEQHDIEPHPPNLESQQKEPTKTSLPVHFHETVTEIANDVADTITGEEEPTGIIEKFLEGDESSESDEIDELTEEQADYQIAKHKLKSGEKTITPLIKRKLQVKKEVTIDNEVLPIEDTTEDDDDEWVWIEEEVDEEVEVETDEEEIKEESMEEETEKEWGEQEMSEEELEREGAEEGEEEKQTVEAEYKEQQEEIGVEEEEDKEAEVGEEAEVILEEEMKELKELKETVVEELEEETAETDKEYMEERLDEEEEEVEEEIEEEEEILRKKKKRKFKIIKVLKMVKMRKKDVIKKLQEKAAPSAEETLQIVEDEAEKEDEVDEAAMREREMTFELIKTLINEITTLQRKNKLLSKSIVDYYKQKKVDNVQQTETPTQDMHKKYYKRLKIYKEAKLTADAEKERMLAEVESLRQELNSIVTEYEKEKAELLAWEVEVGRGVVTAHTGRHLEESVIYRIVERHKTLLEQLSENRLKLITIQSEMSVTEGEIKQLVVLEGNLNLIDFEQLRMDNLMYYDKLEERENELAHLRKKVLDIVHTHAHVLEKADAVGEDIESTNIKNSLLEIEINQLRENVNKLKKTRDVLRGDTRKMRKNAGLLIRPRLAVDYEETISKVEEARYKLNKLTETFDKRQIIIENLRKQISGSTTYNNCSSEIFPEF